jgi:hypothetical protein
MLKLILLASTVALITTTAAAQHIITVLGHTKTPPAVEDRSQQVHTRRSGTNERIDMYPGMIWRYEAPVAIKQVHIGDEGLVFVQPGETDHVLYIGTCKKNRRQHWLQHCH